MKALSVTNPNCSPIFDLEKKKAEYEQIELSKYKTVVFVLLLHGDLMPRYLLEASIKISCSATFSGWF